MDGVPNAFLGVVGEFLDQVADGLMIRQILLTHAQVHFQQFLNTQVGHQTGLCLRLKRRAFQQPDVGAGIVQLLFHVLARCLRLYLILQQLAEHPLGFVVSGGVQQSSGDDLTFQCRHVCPGIFPGQPLTDGMDVAVRLTDGKLSALFHLSDDLAGLSKVCFQSPDALFDGKQILAQSGVDAFGQTGPQGSDLSQNL